MSRCPCTARALELFVADLTGLSLRRQCRPRPPIGHFERRKAFSTAARLRRPELEEIGKGDDGFVPFDFPLEQAKKNGTTGRPETMRDGMREGNRVRRDERERGADEKEDVEAEDVDWHAEIEISGQWPARTRDREAKVEDEGQEAAHQEETAIVDGLEVMDSVDHVALPGLHVSLPPAHPQLDTGALPTLSVSPAPLPSAPTTARSDTGSADRAANRRARKQRRMVEGSWGRLKAEHEQEREREDAVASEGETAEGEEVAEVLGRIEAMEGPGGVRRGMEKKMRGVEEMTGSAQPPGKGRVKERDLEAREKRAARRAVKRQHDASGAARAELPAKSQAGNQNTKSERKPSKSQAVADSKADQKPSWQPWRIQKEALATKFGPSGGWNPSKKVSPDTLNGIRALRASDPATYTTEAIAKHFEMSPEGVRRILRSKWRPDEEAIERRRVAWERRGVRKWGEMAEKGMKPPKRWREAGLGWEGKERSVEGRKEWTGGQRRREKVGLEEGVGMLADMEGLEERIL